MKYTYMEVKQESTEQIILASLFINLKNCTMYSCLFHILAYRITHSTRQITAVPCNEITPKSVARRDAFCLLYVPNSTDS